MNPKTTTAVILALLCHNGSISENEAIELLQKAGETFGGLVLDDLSVGEMIALLNGEPVEQAERSKLETPDPPKLIIPD